MRPLTWVGLGLIVVVLDLSLDGFDLVADPVGWLLVWVGSTALPPHLDRRLLGGTTVVAAGVSVVLMIPSVAAEIERELPLAWALSLPQVVFVLLLARAMARAAGDAGDVSARGWWRMVVAGTIVLLVLPPVVYGAGVDAVLLLGAVIGTVSVVGAVVLSLRHADRPWAQPVQTPQGRPS